ncbi:MAG TPA: zinc-dependent peptidase [Chitinophagales bacterium]|nr:zinc-dependent peptidase [Chitinophagales bacterium]
MDNTITIGAVIIGLLVAYQLFYYLIYEPVRVLLRWIHHVYFAQLELDQTVYLEKNFPFYRSLLPELKLRFEKRVASFLYNKKFAGTDVEVTGEMKLFVAAAAIQLTFGLRNFWLTEFDEIRLYKESYPLTDYRQKAMGHVSRKGTISLSWSDLQEGFENPEDAVNVGLHEMAHALYISSVEKGWNLSFAVEYRDWEKQAVIEWKKGKQGSEHLMRDYAYGNLFEFFAVSVEYFFEQPAALQNAAPQLYLDLEKLLRLDPMNHPDPVLHGTPVLYPSQPIPLPQYEPIGLMTRVFSNLKNLMYFLSGSACWFIGIVLIYSSVQFGFDFPDEDNPFEGWLVMATALLFIGAFLYIQVFYDQKKE